MVVCVETLWWSQERICIPTPELIDKDLDRARAPEDQNTRTKATQDSVWLQRM